MPAKRIRAAAYVRVSDPSKEESISIESQLDEIRKYCIAKNYVLDESRVYMEALSAVYLPYWRREKLVTMLDEVKDNVDVVVVHAFSRLARKQTEQFIIGDKIEQAGVQLESVTEQFDKTPLGIYMRQTMAFVAEAEVEKMRERIDRGRRKKSQYGLLGQGAPLYGYKFADLVISNNGRTNILKNGRYMYDDKEAVAVERMSLLAEEGMSNRQIAITLTNEGYKPRHGGVWSQATVSQTLRDPVYTGRGYVFRSRRIDELTKAGRRRPVAIPEEEWVALPEGIVPVIIPKERFEKIQERMKLNKNYASRRSNAPLNELLRCGHAICGICQGRMHVQRYYTPRSNEKAPRHPEYFCRKQKGTAMAGSSPHTISIAAAKLDAAAWEVALEYISDPKRVKKLVAELREANKLLGDAEAIKKQIELINKKITNLMKLGEAATDDEVITSLQAQLTDLQKQKKEARGLLDKIEKEDENKESVEKEIAKFEAWAMNFHSLLREPDFEPPYEMKVRVIQVIGIKATVGPDTEEKRIKIEVSPPEIVNAALRSRYSKQLAG